MHYHLPDYQGRLFSPGVGFDCLGFCGKQVDLEAREVKLEALQLLEEGGNEEVLVVGEDAREQRIHSA